MLGVQAVILFAAFCIYWCLLRPCLKPKPPIAPNVPNGYKPDCLPCQQSKNQFETEFKTSLDNVYQSIFSQPSTNTNYKIQTPPTPQSTPQSTDGFILPNPEPTPPPVLKIPKTCLTSPLAQWINNPNFKAPNNQLYEDSAQAFCYGDKLTLKEGVNEALAYNYPGASQSQNEPIKAATYFYTAKPNSLEIWIAYLSFQFINNQLVYGNNTKTNSQGGTNLMGDFSNKIFGIATGRKVKNLPLGGTLIEYYDRLRCQAFAPNPANITDPYYDQTKGWASANCQLMYIDENLIKVI